MVSKVEYPLDITNICQYEVDLLKSPYSELMDPEHMFLFMLDETEVALDINQQARLLIQHEAARKAEHIGITLKPFAFSIEEILCTNQVVIPQISMIFIDAQQQQHGSILTMLGNYVAASIHQDDYPIELPAFNSTENIAKFVFIES